MSEAAVKQYLAQASVKTLRNLRQSINEYIERAETDAAIRRGLDDVKNGRVYAGEEVDAHLREHIAKLKAKKQKCQIAA